jgi:hypothetical protein
MTIGHKIVRSLTHDNILSFHVSQLNYGVLRVNGVSHLELTIISQSALLVTLVLH